jgi:hypothetical protein
MGTMGKIFAGLGGTAALFTLLGGLWVTGQTFATDEEVTAAVTQVTELHMRDKVTAAEALKNSRIDGVDGKIRNLERLIEFGDPAQKAWNERELTTLQTLKQNIIEDLR